MGRGLNLIEGCERKNCANAEKAQKLAHGQILKKLIDFRMGPRKKVPPSGRHHKFQNGRELPLPR